jgi:DNA-binding response OmpR family regulator
MATNNNKAKVFLAEDDSSLGFVIKDNLEEEGFEVVHCLDGQTAMERFNKDEFDICLLDVMMPNKDGFAVAKKNSPAERPHPNPVSYIKIYGRR